MSDVTTAMKDGETKMNKAVDVAKEDLRSEEHTSELQSH